MASNTPQVTLTGEETDVVRMAPSTMLWCPECEEHVLRSRRDDHPHDLEEERDITEQKEALSDDCNILTSTYEVEFTYEYREVVRVEASSKADAKAEAQHEQTYDGVYVDTLHSRTREIGDESIATFEYLENHGLLPDDHDVTPADLERLAAQEE